MVGQASQPAEILFHLKSALLLQSCILLISQSELGYKTLKKKNELHRNGRTQAMLSCLGVLLGVRWLFTATRDIF